MVARLVVKPTLRASYHLYYQVNAEAGRVEVLAFWHAQRGRGPSV